MRYRTPEYHPAFEEYCETIFELAEDDFEVIQARIAERLEVSRPAVSEMIHRLENAGLVNAADGTIKLTPDGQELAASVVRRHRLAERFLTEPDSRQLCQIPVGGQFTVNRIPEELEFTPGLLAFLEESSLIPGEHGTVTASSPDGTVTVEIDGRYVGVGSFASERIMVTTA